MSVGSLYQYYPNRDALLAAVLEAHLVGLAEAIERVCHRLGGEAIPEIASGLTTTFLAAKLRNLEESKALYAIASERGGAELVARVSPRMVEAIATMLATARDVHFDDPAVVATVALSAILGTMRAVLEGYTPANFGMALERQVTLLLTAYLQSFSKEEQPYQATSLASRVKCLPK